MARIEGQDGHVLIVNADGSINTTGGGVGATVDVTDRSARVLGHINVDSLPALPVGTNLIGHVIVDAGISVLGSVNLVDGTLPTQKAAIDAAGDLQVDVNNFPASQAVTLPAGQAVELLDSAGTNKATISAAGALKVDGSAVTQPVSGTFFQATQPVSGTVTGNQGTPNTAANAWPAKVTDGTNVGAVKAASTAAVAADPAQVVTIGPNTPLPAGTNVLGALSANQSVNYAQVAGTATSVNSGAADAGTQRVIQAGPAAANILVGQVAQTATTAATTIITIPANRTWVGEVTVACDVAIAAASTTAGQALGTVATAGTTVTPAAATVFTVEARCGANASTGTVGSQQANSASIQLVIAAGTSSATLTLASTQAGTASRVSATASGVLI